MILIFKMYLSKEHCLDSKYYKIDKTVGIRYVVTQKT